MAATASSFAKANGHANMKRKRRHRALSSLSLRWASASLPCDLASRPSLPASSVSRLIRIHPASSVFRFVHVPCPASLALAFLRSLVDGLTHSTCALFRDPLPNAGSQSTQPTETDGLQAYGGFPARGLRVSMQGTERLLAVPRSHVSCAGALQLGSIRRVHTEQAIRLRLRRD